MSSRRTVVLVGVLATLGALVVAVQTGFLWSVLAGDDYGRATVTVVDEDGSVLATVDVRVADTRAKRYVGLSETESLAPGTGMLFVHPSEGVHAYVMRDMAFPLDVVFIDANGTITTIHHASVPPPGTDDAALRRYRGRGKWVLEVSRGWANRTGVQPGDTVRIDGVDGTS